MATILHIILLLSSVMFIGNVSNAHPNEKNNKRTGKFFGSATTEVTKLIVDNLIVTTVVPSSCVAYEPTLRPCRRFRFLNYGPLFTATTPQNNQSQMSSNTTTITSNRRQSTLESTPPLIAPIALAKNNSINSKPTIPTNNYWGDYLSFLRGGVVTKTKTATRLITETFYDPSRVITFSIKHCLPTQMPFNLPKCPPQPQSEILEIKNESTSSLKVPDEQEMNGNVIEPTLTWSIPTIVTTSVMTSSSTPPLDRGDQGSQRIDQVDGTFIKPSEIVY